MVRAKNYETVSTFGKVMQRKLLACFFSGHGVHVYRLVISRIDKSRSVKPTMWPMKISNTTYPLYPVTQLCLKAYTLHRAIVAATVGAIVAAATVAPCIH